MISSSPSSRERPATLAELGPGGDTLATDCHWLIADLEALYGHDQRGRITTRKDAPGEQAPRFVLGRTRHGNVWRSRADLAGALVRGLSRLAAREPVLPAAAADWRDAERRGAIQRLLEAEGRVVEERAVRVFRLPAAAQGLTAGDSRAEGSELLEGDAEAIRSELRDALPALAAIADRCRPIVVSRAGGRIASACHRAAGDPARVAEARVETAPEHRGHDHAIRATAGWMRAVRRLGGTPLYRAPCDERASLALAGSLLLDPFADTLQWT